jgi:hypothetical protein
MVPGTRHSIYPGAACSRVGALLTIVVETAMYGFQIVSDVVGKGLP